MKAEPVMVRSVLDLRMSISTDKRACYKIFTSSKHIRILGKNPNILIQEGVKSKDATTEVTCECGS